MHEANAELTIHDGAEQTEVFSALADEPRKTPSGLLVLNTLIGLVGFVGSGSVFLQITDSDKNYNLIVHDYKRFDLIVATLFVLAVLGLVAKSNYEAYSLSTSPIFKIAIMAIAIASVLSLFSFIQQSEYNLSLRHGFHKDCSPPKHMDCFGENLANVNLSGADLRGADLSGADLSGADLSGADLSGANINSSVLFKANLSGADLTNADFSKSNLTDANLTNTVLRYTNFELSTLIGADLTDAIRFLPKFSNAFMPDGTEFPGNLERPQYGSNASARKGCSYNVGGVGEKIANHRMVMTFSDGTSQCKNGKWILIRPNDSNGETDNSNVETDNSNVETDRAVSIICRDYRGSGECQVTWSSGKKTWGWGRAQSGGVVGGTSFLDTFGKRVCVDLYATGGFKTSYC